MQAALLIIDVQHALCSGEHKAFEVERVIERIDSVARKARSAGAAVVLIQRESLDGPLRFGTQGWKLAQELEALPTDIYVRKQATDSFPHTSLHSVLQERGVKSLVICGLQSEFCVDTTTRRATPSCWSKTGTLGLATAACRRRRSVRTTTKQSPTSPALGHALQPCPRVIFGLG